LPSYSFEPIGFVRSPFVERAAAPRQAVAPASEEAATSGRIELVPGHGYEDGLDGLAGWSHAWIVFVFHKNVEEGRGWKPKVQPPRSTTKRGVFATRSPHRPNPIGISAVAIERVEGLVVHVGALDLLDGTPVLDIKPYVAYADARSEGRAGWLDAPDPIARWPVVFEPAAREQLAWLDARGVPLTPAIEAALALGPQPHAYRRIRLHGDGMRLAIKEWRVDFRVEGKAGAASPVQRIVVTGIASGYREKQLASDPALALHRDFLGRFTNTDGLTGR
jgi:tRNA-Thr(GGU) m(6)t(6)A37 methyltransferase TsaA